MSEPFKPKTGPELEAEYRRLRSQADEDAQMMRDTAPWRHLSTWGLVKWHWNHRRSFWGFLFDD